MYNTDMYGKDQNLVKNKICRPPNHLHIPTHFSVMSGIDRELESSLSAVQFTMPETE